MMNIAIWILAGGALGWAGYMFLGLNEERGRMVSVIIGAAGAVLGGQMIAPMFGAAAAVPGEFSKAVLFFVIAAAAACVVAANLVYQRWGV